MPNPSKILVIRFSSIGDIVLTTPIVRCLKQQIGAEIHYLTKVGFSSILSANPYIDKVITIEKEVKEILPALKEAKYDFIVDLHKNIRSMQIRKGLGVATGSFDKLNISKWLMVNLKVNRLPDIHIVDRYFKAVEKWNIKNDGKGMDYFIPQDQQIDLSTFFEDTSNHPYIAFVIGAAHATKRMPDEKIAAICKGIKGQVILLGGKDSVLSGDQICKLAGAHVRNTCGQLSLHQSASLVQQAKLVISHDTGLMHIAAAFQKPILSLWGNTIPAFGMYPYYGNQANKNNSFEVKNLSCRPCSKIGYDVCPKGHFKCMNGMDVNLIVDQVNKYGVK